MVGAELTVMLTFEDVTQFDALVAVSVRVNDPTESGVKTGEAVFVEDKSELLFPETDHE